MDSVQPLYRYDVHTEDDPGVLVYIYTDDDEKEEEEEGKRKNAYAPRRRI